MTHPCGHSYYLVREITIGVIDPFDHSYNLVREIIIGVIDPFDHSNYLVREITIGVIDPCGHSYYLVREITMGVIDPFDHSYYLQYVPNMLLVTRQSRFCPKFGLVQIVIYSHAYTPKRNYNRGFGLVD